MEVVDRALLTHRRLLKVATLGRGRQEGTDISWNGEINLPLGRFLHGETNFVRGIRS